MPTSHLRRTALALAFPLLLAACGGGGGGSGSGGGGVNPPPAAATFNFDNAAERVLTLGTSLGASATDGTTTLTLQYSVTPQTDAAFENTLRRRSIERARLLRGSTVLSDESATVFYGTGPTRFFGSTDADGYTVVTSTGNLPTAGMVGQSGAFLTSITYSDSTKATIVARETQTWSLETGPSASTAYACLNSSYLTAGGAPDGSAAQCYLIDTTGNVSGLRVTITADGQTVVFR